MNSECGRIFFQTESFIFGECNKSHVQQRRKLWNYKSDSAVYLYHFDSWAQVFFSWAKLVNHLDIILRNLSPIDSDYYWGINESLVTFVKQSYIGTSIGFPKLGFGVMEISWRNGFQVSWLKKFLPFFQIFGIFEDFFRVEHAEGTAKLRKIIK